MKKKKPLIITLILIAVLALGTAIFFIVRAINSNHQSSDSKNTSDKLLSYPKMIEILSEAYDTEIESDNDADTVTGTEAILETMKVNGLSQMKAATQDFDLTDEKITEYAVELELISEDYLEKNITRKELENIIESVKEFNFSESGMKDYVCIEEKDGAEIVEQSDILYGDDDFTTISVVNSEDYQVGDYIIVEDENGLKLARQVEEISDGELSLVYADYAELFDKYEAQETMHINTDTIQDYVAKAGGELLYVEPIEDVKVASLDLSDDYNLLSAGRERFQVADLNISGDGTSPLSDVDKDGRAADASWAIKFAYTSSNDFSETSIANVALTVYDYEKMLKWGFVVPLSADEMGPVSFDITLSVIDELTITTHGDLIGEKKAGITLSGEFSINVHADLESTNPPRNNELKVPIPMISYGGSALGVIEASVGFSLFLDLNAEGTFSVNHINPYMDMEIDLDDLSVSFPAAPEPENKTTYSWEIAASFAAGIRLGLDVKIGNYRITGGSYIGAKGGIEATRQDDGCICMNATFTLPYVKAALLINYPNLGLRSVGTLNISAELDNQDLVTTKHFEKPEGGSYNEVKKCSYGDDIEPVNYTPEDDGTGQEIIDNTVKLALKAYADYFENFVNTRTLKKVYDGEEYYFYNPKLDEDEEIWFGLAYLDDDEIPEFVYGINSEDYQVSELAACTEKATVLQYAYGQAVVVGTLGMYGKFDYLPFGNGMVSYETKGADLNSMVEHIYRIDEVSLEECDYTSDASLMAAAEEIYADSTTTTYYERGMLTSQNLAILRTDDWKIFLDSDGTLSNLDTEDEDEVPNEEPDNYGTEDSYCRVESGTDISVDLNGDGTDENITLSIIKDDSHYKYGLSVDDNVIDVYDFILETVGSGSYGIGRENWLLDTIYNQNSKMANPDMQLMIADIDPSDDYREILLFYPEVFTDYVSEGSQKLSDAIVILRYDDGFYLYNIVDSGKRYINYILWHLYDENYRTLLGWFDRDEKGYLTFNDVSLNDTSRYYSILIN